jgi:signal peptidase I
MKYIIASTAGFLLSILFIADIGEFYYYNPYYLRQDDSSGRWFYLNKFPQKVKRNKLYVYNYKSKNYLSRCVAISGDSIEIIAGKTILNNKKFDNSATRFLYKITSKSSIADSLLKFNLDFKQENINGLFITSVILYPNQSKLLSAYPMVYKINKVLPPLASNLVVNIDFYPQIYVPHKGDTVYITQKNKIFYRNNTEPLFQDNVSKKVYFIAIQDYVFMLNDFKNCLNDSRSFGLIGSDQLFGKMLLNSGVSNNSMH